MNAENLFDRLFRSERCARVAVLYEHREITYDQLREATVRTAETLHALGIVQGDRVAILLSDSPEFIASFVAIISLGAIAVPINMALRKSEQLFILKDCGVRAAIIEAQAANALLGSLDDSNAATAELTDLKDLLVVCRETDGIIASISGMKMQRFDEAQRLPLGDGVPIRGRENREAFILYTSGSTGEPKGAVHRQSDIFYTNETYCREVLRLHEGDRLFSSSRLPFAYGLGNAFTFPLLNGFSAILCREKPAPEVVARVFQDYRPTIFFGVPVVYRMLLEHHRNVQALDASSLRLCISAGEALPAQLGEQWQKTFGVEVLDGIGSTEMLHMFMSNHEGDGRYGSSGRLLKGHEAKLVDHDERPVAQGAEGNLWIRGASAAKRYWQRPETSAARFVNGWVRTGDLYCQDHEGVWWHMGRSDDCFKPTGQWVSPVEVEGVLVQSEKIRAAAVVEGFDKDGLSCVCAFIVRADDSESEERIEQSLREMSDSALPRFKQPRRYIFVSELPYTATGKVQRFKLREQLRAQSAQAGQ